MNGLDLKIFTLANFGRKSLCLKHFSLVPDETPAVTLMYELADEMTAGGTIQDISPGQEARLKEEFDLVSDTNTDSLQEERDTNDSTPPKVKKPRNPPKW